MSICYSNKRHTPWGGDPASLPWPESLTGLVPWRLRHGLFFIHTLCYSLYTMQEQIKAHLKTAMMAREADKVQTIRMIMAAFTNELVTQGRPPQEVLSDEDCMKVIKRLAKQRKDSIEQYTAGGREDLAEDEKKELGFIEAYLPAQMTEQEIENRVREMLAQEAVPTDKKGIFVGKMMKELGGNADGAMVKAVVDRLVM